MSFIDYYDKKYVQFICERCNSALSRGYCAICGRLVCSACSELIGYARVCKICKEKFSITNYEMLKELLKVRADNMDFKQCKLKMIYDKKTEKLGDYIFVAVGIDDIDSPYGMCTTFAAANLAYKLLEDVEFLDFPLLVRLNPNIPSKTRGNAAVALRFRVESSKFHKIRSLILSTVERFSHSGFRKTNTGVVIYYSNSICIPRVFVDFYELAVKNIVSINDVFDVLDKMHVGNIEVYDCGNNRGIIGALAAIGAQFDDWTYELLTYRASTGYDRIVDKTNVISFDKYSKPYTFGNVHKERILITPHGLDPVLYGIRGDFPEVLLSGLFLIKSENPVLWCIFRTNQATDTHINEITNPEDAKPYLTVKISAKVCKILKEDRAIVILARVKEWLIKAYAYEPMGPVRKIVQKLKTGDVLELTGAVFYQDVFEKIITMNIEKIRFVEIVPEAIERNPFCPKCLARLKSKGRKYLVCPKCGFRIEKTKIIILSARDIKENSLLLPPPSAYRHLTKPPEREKIAEMKKHGILKPYLVYPFVGIMKPYYTIKMDVIQPKIV